MIQTQMTSTLPKLEDEYIFSSVRYKLDTPEGKAYIFIIEDKDKGKLAGLTLAIGKSGSTLNAYCYAVAELTLSLINTRGHFAALEMLSGITSDKSVSHLNGMVCRNGIEALFIALLSYYNSLANLRLKHSRRPSHWETRYIR